jgi:hypothetical protein
MKKFQKFVLAVFICICATAASARMQKLYVPMNSQTIRDMMAAAAAKRPTTATAEEGSEAELEGSDSQQTEKRKQGRNLTNLSTKSRD